MHCRSAPLRFTNRGQLRRVDIDGSHFRCRPIFRRLVAAKRSVETAYGSLVTVKS